MAPGGAVEPDGEQPRGLDVLDVLDALCAHYGETVREALTGWSWKLFCARWRRLIEYMEAERARRRTREREEEFRRLEQQTAQEHARRSQHGFLD